MSENDPNDLLTQSMLQHHAESCRAAHAADSCMVTIITKDENGKGKSLRGLVGGEGKHESHGDLLTDHLIDSLRWAAAAFESLGFKIMIMDSQDGDTIELSTGNMDVVLGDAIDQIKAS